MNMLFLTEFVIEAAHFIGTAAARQPRHINSTKWLTDVGTASTFNHMVESQTPQLDAVFHALGDATRRRMLRALADGERTVTELAAPFEMSLAAASKHIKALEGAGLIQREVRGRTHICRLDAAPLSDASDWLRFYEQFWTTRLDALERLLRDGPAKRSPTAPPKGKR
jgi:DNA-binding transcriptional ArsR family regulator